jgi:hypothetical protein
MEVSKGLLGIRSYFCTAIFVVAILQNFDQHFLLFVGQLQSSF